MDRNVSKKSSLLAAASLGDIIQVSRLLKMNADLEEVNESGWTPLMFAAHYGHYNICKLLLESGAKANVKEWQQGRTPLMMASACGHTRCIEALINIGNADIDDKDRSGKNAAYYATHSGHGRNKLICKLLRIQSKSRVISRPQSRSSTGSGNSNDSQPPAECSDKSPFESISPTEDSSLSFTPYLHFPRVQNNNSMVSNNCNSQNLNRLNLPPIGTQLPSRETLTSVNLDFLTPNTEIRSAQKRLAMSEGCCEYPRKQVKSTTVDVFTSESAPLPETIEDLLQILGMEQYQEIFEREAIDLYCFLTLTEADFTKLGVIPLGHKRKLSLAQKRFQESAEITVNPRERVFADWLLSERESLVKEIQHLRSRIEELESY